MDHDAPAPDGDAGSDAGDTSDGGPGGNGDAAMDAEARAPSCKPSGPFETVELLPGLEDLGEVWSVRPERYDAGDGITYAMAAIDAGPGTYFDLKEGPLAGPYYSSLATGRGERSPALLDDGLHLYFEADESDGGRVIVATARDSFGQNFTGSAQTIEPLPLPMGVLPSEPWSVAGKDVVYFTISPGTSTTRDIFRAEKKISGWELAPESALATTEDEGFPVVTDDELVMYFARTVSSKTAVYYVTRKTKTDAWTLPPTAISDTRVDDGASDSYPTWVSPDGCTFFFVSNRAGGIMRAYRVVVSLSP